MYGRRMKRMYDRKIIRDMRRFNDFEISSVTKKIIALIQKAKSYIVKVGKDHPKLHVIFKTLAKIDVVLNSLVSGTLIGGSAGLLIYKKELEAEINGIKEISGLTPLKLLLIGILNMLATLVKNAAYGSVVAEVEAES